MKHTIQTVTQDQETQTHNNVIYVWENCGRCAGTGHLDGYEHVEGGRCFLCEGALGKWTKAQTIVQRLKARDRRAQARAAKEAQSEKRAEQRAAVRAEQKAAAQEITEGRQVVTGKITSKKTVHGSRGRATQYKITFQDQRGFKVHGTAPKALVKQYDQINSDSLISFTATLTTSPTDKKFGFFSRPTKVEVN